MCFTIIDINKYNKNISISMKIIILLSIKFCSEYSIIKHNKPTYTVNYIN